MLNVELQNTKKQHNTLIVKLLQKYAENGVFWPNISFVEKKRVDLAIDCYRFSERMEAKGNMEMRWEQP